LLHIYAEELAVPTQTDSPTDVVRAFLAAMSTLDYDAALPHIAENCEYENIPMPGSTVYGPDGVRGLLEPFFAPTIENEFLILREAESGPVVFVERLDRHRIASGWLELPVTGVFEVHDGQITLWRDYFNLATLEAMLVAAAP